MADGKAAQTIRTRARIRRAGLTLFNERGTPVVNTHDIAALAGISPGNLYYHYKNKDEIIRDLMEAMPLHDPGAWQAATQSGGFSGFLEFFFDSLAQYRFFFREFPTLLSADRELARLWRHRFRKLMEVLREAAQGWVKSGQMHPFETAESLDSFVETAWVVMSCSEYFLAEISPSVSRRQIQETAKNRFLMYLIPYHTDKGKTEILRHLKGQ